MWYGTCEHDTIILSPKLIDFQSETDFIVLSTVFPSFLEKKNHNERYWLLLHVMNEFLMSAQLIVKVHLAHICEEQCSYLCLIMFIMGCLDKTMIG